MKSAEWYHKEHWESVKVDTRFSGFKLSTAVTNESPVSISTSRATVRFLPDEKGNLIEAEVIVHNRMNDAETQDIARKELIKVILAKLSPNVRILSGPLKAVETPTDESDKRMARRGQITLPASFAVSRSYDEDAADLLQIDSDSNSEAIYAYYQTNTKADPIDRFRDFFKVIEFLCGDGSPSTLRDCEGSKWWIPEEVIVEYQSGGLSREKAVELISKEIAGLRNKCSHLKPKYGARLVSREDRQLIDSRLSMIESIAELSLERNPETCK